MAENEHATRDYGAEGRGILNRRVDYEALAKEAHCEFNLLDWATGGLTIHVTMKEIPADQLRVHVPTETLSGWKADARERFSQICGFIMRNKTLGVVVEPVWKGGPYR